MKLIFNQQALNGLIAKFAATDENLYRACMKAGVNHSGMYQWQAGKVTPRLAQINMLAKAAGLTAAEWAELAASLYIVEVTE